jgi:hypothetical protein
MTVNLQERKLQIIQQLTILQDERVLRLIEELLFEAGAVMDDEPLSEEERILLDERMADYHANPDDDTPWSSVKQLIQSRHGGL